MKKKSLLFVLLVLMLSLSVIACKRDKRTPGLESGTYYFYQGATKNTITLKEVDKFDFSVNGQSQNGTYQLTDSGQLTLTFSDSKNAPTTGTLVNNTITITYNGETLVFLKEIYFAVTFESNGGNAIAAQDVLNGQFVTEPEKPAKTNHIFMGWCIDNNTFLKQFAFATQRVTEPVTLYAFFVQQSNQEEFTIGLDLNYNDLFLEDRETINGKVYFLPTPERAGNIFKGWWISQYNTADWRSGDPAKLSYEYTNGYEFKESTTLIALWQPTGTNKLDNPIIKVSDTAISWAGVASGISYAIEITKPDGTKVNDTQAGTTFSHTFSVGDNVISVTANPGQSNSSNSIIYYKHKALPRVSFDPITGNTLLFRKVANAASYTVSVSGGAAESATVGTDDRVTFDFSAYEMKPEGIKFIVTASASGFASSQARFVHHKILDKIDENSFSVNAEQVLTWAPVASATGYTVGVAYNSITDTVTVASPSLALKKYPKTELTISVYPTARGFNPSEAVTYKYNKLTQATPQNLRIDGMKIKWDDVTGKTGYQVDIDGTVYPATGTLTAAEMDIPADLEIQTPIAITVRTLGANSSENSLWSDPITLSPSITSLVYDRNELTWNYVFGATEYQISIDGTTWKSVGNANHAEIIFNDAKQDKNTIGVRFDVGTGWSTPVTIDVKVYTLTLNANEGVFADNASTKTLYYAEGDVIAFSEVTRTGYDFEGWYLLAADNSAKYVDETFTGTQNRTLYAHWSKIKTALTYNYGGDGKAGNDGSKELEYGDTDYTLEIPRDDGSSGEIFIGWCTAQNDENTLFTNELGKGIMPWIPGENRAITVYALWADVLHYELISGAVNNDTYAVSKNELKEYLLNRITNLKIPARYNNKSVTEIVGSAFKSSKFLKHVDLPNTIKSVSRNAFDDCSNLQSFGIYTVNNQIQEVYKILSDVLFEIVYVDGNESGYRFTCFPLGRNGIFAIPEKTNNIGNLMFENAFGIEKIIVHANVTAIGSYAFQGSSIKEIEFLKEGGTCALTTIGTGAFKNSTLTKIEIPKSVKDITDEGETVPGIGFAAFAGCRNLTEVKFESGSYDDLSIGGPSTNPADFSGGAFFATDMLMSIKFPARLVSIGFAAFYGSAYEGGLTSVIFDKPEQGQQPKDLIIGVNAFYQCRNLTEIEIPARTTQIQTHAFNTCSKLSLLTFEEGGTKDLEIGVNGYTQNAVYFTGFTFASCAFTAITIPARVTFLGRYVFSSCDSLTTVIFDASNKALKIDDYLFSGCTKLGIKPTVDGVLQSNPVVIPGRTIQLGQNIFSGCTALIDVVFEKNAVSPEEGEVIFTINPIVTSGSSTGFFNNCISLETITVSPSVRGLDYYSLLSCVKLTAFKMNAGLSAADYTEYAIIDGVLFNKGATKLIFYPQLKAGATYNIPGSVNTIAAGAFYSNTANRQLTSIIIPSTVTDIEEKAFTVGTAANASKLTSVRFDSGLIIGASAFYGLTSLTTINFGANANASGEIRIDKSAFQGCVRLENLNFNSDNLEIYIGESAFQNCFMSPYVTAKDLTIGVGVMEIGKYAFQGCTGITGINFITGSRLVTIGSYAFKDCVNLSSLRIPKNVTLFDVSCILNTVVSAISVDPANTSYSDVGGVLYTGNGKELVYCPPGRTGVFEILKEVTTIKKSAFMGSNITSIMFEEGSLLETIDDYAFAFAMVESITLPASVLKIGQYAFQYATIDTLNFENGSVLKTIDDYAFKYSAITSVELPEGLETIGSYAFQGTAITAITIPSTLTYIGTAAFADCTQLVGLLFTAHTGPNPVELVLEPGTGTGIFSGCTSLASLDLTNSRIKVIPAYTFSNNTALANLTIPSTVTEIKAAAFFGMGKSVTGAVTVTIEDGSEPLTVADAVITTTGGMLGSTTSLTHTGVFAESGITAVTAIPARLTAIADLMFYKCARLESMVIPTSVTTVGSAAFYGCNSLGIITISSRADGLVFKPTLSLGNSMSGLTYYGTFEATAITGIDLAKIGVIPEYAFKNCTQLSSISIPSVVTSIGNYAFSGCTALNNVVIPSTVTTVGTGAFNGCTGLTNLTIDSRTGILNIAAGTSAASGAFANTGITAIDFSIIKMTTIPAYTFYGCKGLGAITIPDNITNIGASAFYGCTSINSINIPASLETVGTAAFGGCTNLSALTFSARVAQLTITAGSDANSGAFANTKINGILDLSNSNLTTVPAYTFYGCGSLTGVNIPATVRSIGNFAFAYSALASIVINTNSVSQIGTGAFQGCAGLASVSFSGSLPLLETIASSAFAYTGISTITIPASVQTIGAATTGGANVFQGCANLTEILVNPQNAKFTSVDGVLFDKLGMLLCYPAGRTIAASDDNDAGEYIIPTSYNIDADTSVVVTTIAASAFHDVKVLNKVFIPLSVLTINAQAFRGAAIAEIRFEEFTAGKTPTTSAAITSTADTPRVLTIAAGSSLTTGVFSESGLGGLNGGIPLDLTYSRITTISAYTFPGCTSLKQVTIPAYVTTINDGAFLSCTSLNKVEFLEPAGEEPISRLTLASGWSASGVFGQTTSLTEITFATNRPLTLTAGGSGGYEFIGSGIQMINIPADTTISHMGVFARAENLKAINIISASINDTTKVASGYSTVGGVLFNNPASGGATLLYYPVGKSDSEGNPVSHYTVPATINTTRGTTADVTIIGTTAFDLHSGVAAPAGSLCNTTLTEITLPNTVTTINSKAFKDCTELTTINMTTSIMGIKSAQGGLTADIFTNCYKLTNINVTEAINETDGFLTKSVDGVIFGFFMVGTRKHVALIRYPVGRVNTEYAIPYRINFGTEETLDWREVTAIATNAFTDCKFLTKINVPASIEYIGRNAFSPSSPNDDITRLDEIYFQSFEETYGRKPAIEEEKELVFESASSAGIFYNCIALTKVNLPERVKTIPNYLFYNCKTLAIIIIPASVTTITCQNPGDSPFFNCAALTTIYVHVTEKPDGWSQYWNVIAGGTASQTYAPVVWGYKGN